MGRDDVDILGVAVTQMKKACSTRELNKAKIFDMFKL